MEQRTKFMIGGLAAGTLLAGAAAGVGTAIAIKRGGERLRRYRRRELRGQTVLITGGSRGLGLAMAEEFAEAGAKIAMCARHEEELLRARQHLEQMGVEVCAVACDVSRPEQVQHLIDSVQQQLGRIDVLVNNAGAIAAGPLLSQTVEDFEEAMNVMFWGTVHPTLAVLPQMISRPFTRKTGARMGPGHGRGKVVNITSIGGRVAVPHLVPYCCAKFACAGFSEGLHAELKRFGIHVLTVVPGLMRTGSHLNAQFKGKHKHEFGWFALSGTNPLSSISARRAARKIVAATCSNRADLVIGWQAKLMAEVHGVAPGLTQEAMALVNRLLPDAGGVTDKKPGHESQSVVTRSPLTMLGKWAARRYNQLEEIA